MFRINTVADHRRCVDFISNLPRGKRWAIEVDEITKKRSIGANKFYWGYVVTPLAEHVGETPEKMHEIILCELYGFTTKVFRGKEYQNPNRRTSDMSDKEFNDHIHLAQAMAAEEGVDSGPMFGSNWSA